MTNRLTLHLPGNRTITFESDNINNIADMADFCKEKFGAYSASEEYTELTIDKFDEENEEELISKAFLLGLIF